MARKDVELVIRAKNEASKVVESVTSALKSLTTAQSGAVSSAEKTGSSLARLGTALNDLSKSFKGATIGDTLAKELGAAQTAIANVEGAIGKLEAEQAKLAAATTKATMASAEQAQKLADAGQKLEAQKAAVQTAKAAQDDLSNSIRKATAERDRLARVEENTTAEIAKQKGILAELGTKYEELAKKVLTAETPTKRLQQQFESSVASIEKTEAKIAELTTVLATNGTALQKSVTNLGEFNARAEGVVAAVEREKAAFIEAEAAHKSFGASVVAATKLENDLKTQASALTGALGQEYEALIRADAALQEFKVASGLATAEQAKLGAAIRSSLLKAFGDQRAQMLAAQSEYLKTQATVKTLAGEMKAVAQPSAEMVANFQRAVISAKQAKDAYLAQQVALQQMRTSLRSSGSDFESLVGAQQRFAQSQEALGKALGEAKDRAEEAAEAQKKLAAEGDKAARETANTASQARSAASGLDAGAKGTSRFAEAMRGLYGDSRQAMSITQRLRGEVLSLVVAYGGIQGAIQGIRAVINAYKELQAANNRLQVVFDGNKNATANEMDFLRRTANRLGIEFGTLAGEYSKFAIATKDTNLQGENTRKIFTAVAEAAVVNGTSLEDTKGVYLALTQIVSKGAVQMEELRQQLGDRLPGALQLMADGLGVTTAQLIKMMEQGQVASTALVGFADSLNKKFGGQLAESLLGVNAQIAAFQNNVFNALLVIGNSTAMDKFVGLLKLVNTELKSAEAESFFRKLGVAIGYAFDALKFLVENIRSVTIALSALFALKVGGVITAAIGALVLGLSTTAGTATRAVAAVNLFRVATGAATISIVSMQGALIAARAALTGLTSSTGIGLLIAAVGAGIAYWATSTAQTDKEMTKFRDTLDKIKDAYDKATGSAKNLADATKGVTTKVALEVQRDQLRKAFDKSLDDINLTGKQIRGGRIGGIGALDQIIQQFKQQKISAQEAKDAIDKLAASNPNLDRTVLKQYQDLITTSGDLQEAIKKNSALIRASANNATEADKALLGLGDATKGATNDLGAGETALKNYTKAIETLKDAIPELAAELKKLKSLAEINAAGLEAFKAGVQSGNIDQIRSAINLSYRAQGAINEQFVADAIKEVAGATKITAETLRTIKQREGLRTEAYRDSGGVPTIGLGNTTYADGRRVQMGDKISEAEAYTLAVKALADISGNLDARIQVPITAAMRDALISYAYNVGVGSPGLARTIEELNKRNYAGAQESIRNGINTVKGVPQGFLTKRRAEEAQQFGSEGLEGFEITKERVQAEEEKIKKAKEYQEQLKEELATQKFNLEQDKAGGVQAEINKAIREKELEARKAGTVLGEEERKQIIANTTELYNQQHAEDAGKEKKKAAVAAEKEITAEIALRTALQKQLQLQMNQGDLSGAEATRASLEQINAQLADNIPKAIAMWQAIGGVEADAAITKLKAVQTSLQGAGQQILINWKQVDQTFANTATNGIMSAVDALGQAAAGTRSWGDALAGVGQAFLKFAADFLRQIAEMIIKQAILNALQSATGGSPGSPGGSLGIVASAVMALVKHDGGLALAGAGVSRAVPPQWFNNAVRYHTGGVAGLKPNEIPAILEKNEEVLTEDDPRHIFNQGGGANGVRNILAFNDEDIANAMASSAGERVMLTYLKRNAPTLRKLFG